MGFQGESRFKTHLDLIVSKAELFQFNTRLERGVNSLKLAIRERELEPEEILLPFRIQLMKLAPKELNTGGPFTLVIDFTFTRASPILQIGFLERTADGFRE